MNYPADDREFISYLKKSVLPIRTSQYDITNTCNLTCEGCLFFSGDDYKGHPEERDLGKINQFFASEARRGVNCGFFAGAEPSLAENKLLIAAKHIKRGNVLTNGTRRISREIPYSIHVSIWGLGEESKRLRGADIAENQFRNYRDDQRATFIFTINHQNVDRIPDVARVCANHGARLSFNHFSPPSGYLQKLNSGVRDPYFRLSSDVRNLVLTSEDLRKSEALIEDAMASHGETVVYDASFNSWVHRTEGLYRVEGSDGIAAGCPSRLTKRFRHFNADLVESSAKCCSPNIECSQCRLYVQSLATSIASPSRSDIQDDGGLRRWASFWRLWCRLFLVH